uniref:Uncharacterized protein n=1 Tax=Sipha flava TaxID=143950 RepID=A0A2S2R1S0_9HEMI
MIQEERYNEGEEEINRLIQQYPRFIIASRRTRLFAATTPVRARTENRVQWYIGRSCATRRPRECVQLSRITLGPMTRVLHGLARKLITERRKIQRKDGQGKKSNRILRLAGA